MGLYLLRYRSCVGPRRRGAWLALAAALAVLAALDVDALAHLDGLTSVLPVALRQPLVATVIIALCLLPPLAFRAAARACRPRLFAVRQPVPARRQCGHAVR